MNSQIFLRFLGSMQLGTLRFTVLLGLISISSQGCGVAIQGSLASLFSVDSGNFQICRVNEELPSAFRIQVLSDSGNPVANTKVSWTIFEQNGALQSEATDTDSEGYAWNYFRCGKRAGIQKVFAKVPKIGTTETFLIEALPGTPGKVEIIAGNGTNNQGQIVTVNETLGTAAGTSPLEVRATDLFGNPLKDVNLQWEVQSGGGLLHDPITLIQSASISAVSDLNGYSSMHYQVGTRTNETHRVIVTIASGPSFPTAEFLVRVQADAPTSLTYVSGNGQADVTVGQYAPSPLIVVARDQWQNPVPGASINWKINSGDGNGAILSQDTPNGIGSATLDLQTNSEGLSIVYFRTGTKVESQTAEAKLGTDLATFSIGVIPDVAFKVVAESSTNLIGTVGELVTPSPQVTLYDQYENPTTRGKVKWTVTDTAATIDGRISDGGAEVMSLTTTVDGSGLAQVSYRLGRLAFSDSNYPGYPNTYGDFLIASAVHLDDSPAEGPTELFQAAANPSVPDSIEFINFPPVPNNVISNETLGADEGIQLIVRDQYGNPTQDANGIRMTLDSETLYGTTDQSYTSTGNIDGKVVFDDLTIRRVGTFTLTAEVPTRTVNQTSTSFTVGPGPPAKLFFTTQPLQTRAGEIINSPTGVRVEIRDASDNRVTWAENLIHIEMNPDNSTTFTGTTTVRANNGVATFSNLSQTFADSYLITASADFGTPDVNSNSFNIVANDPYSITKIQGDNQIAESGSTLGTAFTVEVKDYFGNVNKSQAMTWGITGGGSFNSSDATTDASGRASSVGIMSTSNQTNTITVYPTGFSGLTATFYAFDFWDAANDTLGFGGGSGTLTAWNSGRLQKTTVSNPTPSTGNVIGYWDLDPSGGTSVGVGSTISSTRFTSQAMTVQGSTMSIVSGIYGRGALDFNGTTQYIRLPSNVPNSSSFTFSSWVYWRGGGTWQRIFDFGQNATVNFFLTPRSGDNTLRAAITTSGNSGEQKLNSSALPINQWVHVAVTINGSTNTAKLYLNGFPVDTQTWTLGADNIAGANNYLGDSQYTADPYFNGMLADVFMWNTALSDSQVADLYGYQTPAVFTSRVFSLPSGTGLSWTNFLWNSPRPFGKPISDDGLNLRSQDYPSDSRTAANNLFSNFHFEDFTDSVGTSNASPTGGVSSTTGIIGQAKSFDGINDEMCFNTSNSNWNIGAGQFSVSVWAKNLGSPGYAYDTSIVGFRNGTYPDSDDVEILVTKSNNRLRFLFRDTLSREVDVDTTNLVHIDEQWHHIVGTRSGGTVRLYWDGQLVTTGTTTSTMNINLQNGSGCFGAFAPGNRRFKGHIDEAAFYRRALSATEVMDLYRRGSDQVKFQFRSCTNSSCSDNPSWLGPDGSSSTYFSEHQMNTSLSNNGTPNGSFTRDAPQYYFPNFVNFSSAFNANRRWFQYRLYLESENKNGTIPEINPAIVIAQ